MFGGASSLDLLGSIDFHPGMWGFPRRRELLELCVGVPMSPVVVVMVCDTSPEHKPPFYSIFAEHKETQQITPVCAPCILNTIGSSPC